MCLMLGRLLILRSRTQTQSQTDLAYCNAKVMVAEMAAFTGIKWELPIKAEQA
jgi:hypothetical protein